MCLQIILGVGCLYRQVKTCHQTTCLTSTANFSISLIPPLVIN